MSRPIAAQQRFTPDDGRNRCRPDVGGIYKRLHYWYGAQHWWPAANPFEMMVGAVLTQATRWYNVEQAIARLEAAGCLSPEAIYTAPDERLQQLVRPSGYFRAKARKLKALATHIVHAYGGSVESMLARPLLALRRELLGIYGIGPETADCIVLYAAEQPVFVIDAYTLRAGERLGLFPRGTGYAEAQQFFHRALPPHTPLYQEFHALWVALGKDACQTRPRCDRCPLVALCPTGQARRAPDRTTLTSRKEAVTSHR